MPASRSFEVTCWTNERLSRAVSPRAKLASPSDHAQGRIENDPFLLHRGDGCVGNFVNVRAMLDGIGPEGDRIGNIGGITAVNGDGKLFGMGFLDNRAENIHVHAIKPITGCARFQNALDGIDLFGGKFVHLLARFLRALRSSDELGVKRWPHYFRQILGVFGSVSALGGEERTAKKQFGPEFFAGPKFCSGTAASYRAGRPCFGPPPRRSKDRLR